MGTLSRARSRQNRAGGILIPSFDRRFNRQRNIWKYLGNSNFCKMVPSALGANRPRSPCPAIETKMRLRALILLDGPSKCAMRRPGFSARFARRRPQSRFRLFLPSGPFKSPAICDTRARQADVAKLVDARDLKSLGPRLCGFDPRRPHQH